MSDIQDVTARQDASPIEMVGRLVDPTTGHVSIVPLKIKESAPGSGIWALDVGATIDASDIEIGAVEIKDSTGTQRASVTNRGAGEGLDVNVIYGGGGSGSGATVTIGAATVTLNNNIVGSDVTLNVAVVSGGSSSATVTIGAATVTLNTALVQSDVTLNVAVVSGGSATVTIGAATVTLNTALVQSDVTLNVAVVSGGSATVTIGAATVTLNTALVSSAVTLNANIVNATLAVTGSVASAATDSGNPVKVGAKYNLAGASFADGQRADLQASSSGQLLVSQGVIAGEDFAFDVIKVSANKLTPAISNTICTSSATLYSYTLPAGTKKFMVKARSASDVINFLFANSALTAGVPASAYIGIPASSSYTEEGVKLAATIIYFCSPTSGAVVELLSWQ